MAHDELLTLTPRAEARGKWRVIAVLQHSEIAVLRSAFLSIFFFKARATKCPD
jgi:hypothetical protein